MPKATKRRGDMPDPEVVAQAKDTAGVLAIIFQVDKNALLERPRPSGKLRFVRDVLFGILHHRFGVSQQKIAAALGRDRGVVSDAARLIDEASTGDVAVRFAIVEITQRVSDLMDMRDAWNEALNEATIEAATDKSAELQAEEDLEDEALNAAIVEEITRDAPKIRCHQCYGKGVVRIHALGGDPAYRDAWKAAEAIAHSTTGFHELKCRFCFGLGYRPSSAANRQ